MSAHGALPTLALTAALAACALLFDAEPLWVGVVVLGLLVVGALSWVLLAARGLDVSRRLDGRRVVEGEPLVATLEARGGRLALPGGHLHDPLLSAPAPLRAGARVTRVQVEVRFARRGQRTITAPHAVLVDPLGLVTVRVAGADGDEEILVLPRTEPVRTAPGATGRGRVLRRGRPTLADETDVDGLRPLRPGTPASRIFWPSLARGAELMERRLVSDADTTPLVVLDPRAPEREEDLDAAVRAAASLALHLASRAGVAVLLPGDRSPTVLDATLGRWAHLHARLALVEAGTRPPLHDAVGRRGIVILVSARVIARPPDALLRGHAGGCLLVVPGALVGRRPVFTVAGCHGYDVAGREVRRAVGAEAAGGGG